MTRFTLIGLAVLCGSSLHAQNANRTPAATRDTVQVVRVWVNTDSGKYHCRGTQYYGNTKTGEYLREDEARDRGYEPARDQVCGPLPAKGIRVWVNTNSGVYHCPGSRHYGQTNEGEYATETGALAAGHRPANNKKCGS